MFYSWSERIAELWPETGPYLDNIARYTNMSLNTLLAVAIITYLFYRFLLWRLWKLGHPDHTRRLRGPWFTGLIIAASLQFAVIFIVGISMLSPKPLEVWLAIFLTSFSEAFLAALLFYILTLFSSPLKVMYTPPLRRHILRVFGRAK